MISGPMTTDAGVDVDAGDDDHHALLGQHLAVAEDPVADVADAEPVDVEVAGRDPLHLPHALVGDLHAVAVLAQEDVVVGQAHRPRQGGVVDHVLVLAVHRDEPLGLGDRVVGLELVGLGVAGGVDVLQAGVHDLHAEAHEAVDHLGDVHLVARDRVRAEDDGVVGVQLQELGPLVGHQGQGRHGLALRAGGDHAHLAGVEVAHLVDVAQVGVRDREQAHLPGQAHVLLHRHAEGGHHPVVGDGGVGDLLDAVDVAGEAGGDDPPALVGVEQVVEDLADGGLAAGVAVLVGVGGVGQQEADALVLGDGADGRQVGEAAVDRGEVELEVAAVEDRALRACGWPRRGRGAPSG